MDLSKLNPDTLRVLQTKVAEKRHADALLAEHRWEQQATGKQLPPDHPRHCQPWVHPATGEPYACYDYNVKGDKMPPGERSPHCLTPHKDWEVWVFIAGRGYGKTQSASNWVVDMAMTNPGCKVAVVSSNFAQVQENCFQGDSAIKAVLDENYPGIKYVYNINNNKIVLPNKSIIQGYTAENPKTIRGSNLTFAWLDEYAFYSNDEFITEVLMPALRISRADGGPPRTMITTTPITSRSIRKLLKRCAEDPGYHLTKAFTKEAEGAWLNARAIERMYEGLTPEQIRQELEAEMLQESFTSYFKMRDFDKYRLDPEDVPELDEVVIGVDPAMTSGKRSDEHGIVVMGKGIYNGEYHSFVLEDASRKYSPEEMSKTVCELYWKHRAALVVVETNQGGEFVTSQIRSRDSAIDVRAVHAMKGKDVRAGDIMRLNEVGRLHMVGVFPKLEEQLTRMEPGVARKEAADDRADAYVWGMTHLVKGMGINWLQAYSFMPCPNCGVLVHRLKKICPMCSTEVTGWPKYDHRNEERAAIRWWRGYMTECETCEEKYPTQQGRCLKCHPDPGEYMAAVARLTNAGLSRHVYSGKNWLAGRRGF